MGSSSLKGLCKLGRSCSVIDFWGYVCASSIIGLLRYFGASVDLMQVLARACGHCNLSDFAHRDITTWKKEMADLSGVRFGGVNR